VPSLQRQEDPERVRVFGQLKQALLVIPLQVVHDEWQGWHTEFTSAVPVKHWQEDPDKNLPEGQVTQVL
jgi:hypothetical protein